MIGSKLNSSYEAINWIIANRDDKDELLNMRVKGKISVIIHKLGEKMKDLLID